MDPSFGRVRLRPLENLAREDWRRVQAHFRDPEIAHLNGTPPNRMPLWLLRRVLKADSSRSDRATFGIYDEHDAYIGTVELYELRGATATLGIIIGERSHWSRGYGPEAIHALLGHAFRALGLERVRLNTFGDNARAQAAFRKVGFRELRRGMSKSGRTDVHMEIWRDAWFEVERSAQATAGVVASTPPRSGEAAADAAGDAPLLRRGDTPAIG